MKEINDRAASLECVKASLSGLLLEADLAGIPMEGINEIKENTYFFKVLGSYPEF